MRLSLSASGTGGPGLLSVLLVTGWVGAGIAAAAVTAAAHAVPPALRTAEWLAAAAPDDVLPMSVTFRLQNVDALDALIVAQQTPGSPAYRRWLGAAEFADRFGPDTHDYAAVAEWLEGQGFSVRRWPSRLRLDFAGPVAAVQRTFAVRMQRYRHHGRRVLASSDMPLLPARFAPLIASVRLDTIPLAQPLVRVITASGTVDTMGPRDLYRAYAVQPVLDRGIDGSGLSIAVVARSDFDAGDVLQFQEQFGTTVRAPVKVIADTNPGIGARAGVCRGIGNPQAFADCTRTELGEVLLDVQWAGALAPGATVLVGIGSDIDVSLMYVVSHHPEVSAISISFGACERSNASVLDLVAPIYAQAAVQGQTVLVATGDSGADGCDDGGPPSVNVLASDPNVTAVGGTALDPGFDGTGNATGYFGEWVWNDAYGASGGGPSQLVATPAYQVAPGVPSGSTRAQPDVSLLASPGSPGYVTVMEGSTVVIGGTSVGAPAWAGIVALLNQAAGRTGSGAINYALYPLGQQQYAEDGLPVFHDVSSGNNSVSGVTGFAAGVGYDLATGLGTPNVDLLVHAFAPPTACLGDCNDDGQVTVDELILGVNISLDMTSLAACRALDGNRDGAVTVDELVAATERALNGCGRG